MPEAGTAVGIGSGDLLAIFCIMNTTMDPINKKAACFLSRKARIETIREALDKFASKLCSTDVAQSVREMVASNSAGEDLGLKITLRVRRDQRTADQYVVTMDSRLSKELGREEFFGLR